MTEPLSKKLGKSLSQMDASDLVIRAQVPREDGQGYMALTFLRERVDALADLGGGNAGIILKSGAKIPVAMAYDALEKAIYFADLRQSYVLDLREVTGDAATRAVFPDAAKDFAASAPRKEEPKRTLDDVPLRIAFFARQPQQQNFQMCVLDEEDIDWKSVEGHSDGKNGAYTKFKLRYGESPFGGREVQFDMPRQKFMELYNLAKMNGHEELDVREWTRRRDPDNIPKPPPPPRPPRPPF